MSIFCLSAPLTIFLKVDNMNYVLEAIIVGLYCSVLYVILDKVLINKILKNSLVFFFLLGFFKHFLGYFLGIHDYYCKKCLKNENENENENEKKNVRAKFEPVFYQSVLEGVYFLLVGFIGFFYLDIYKSSYKSSYYNSSVVFFFVVGFLTHIISEWIGLHDYFCKINCDPPLEKVEPKILLF